MAVEKIVEIEKSHPVWVCGLKFNLIIIDYVIQSVTPCLGVWIEILALS